MIDRVFAAPELDTDRPRLCLDGVWRFTYDAGDIGVKKRWFAPAATLPERIQIPGCSQVRRYQSAQGNVRNTAVEIPEHSQTIMLRHGCMHPSWYQRRFTVPADWRGRRVHLHVGGVKPAAQFWINGKPLGQTTTSRSPVRCELTRWIRFGQENTLTVRLHWPRFRLDGVFDIWHAWSGLYRSVWVEALPAANLADVHVLTSIRPKSATVNVTVDAGGPAALGQRKLRAQCRITDGKGRQLAAGAAPMALRQGRGLAGVTLALPTAELWSPESPTLYHAAIDLYAGEELLDTVRLRLGLRELSTRGFAVLLNGKPVFLRGACDDHIYPTTICPPADKEFYRQRIAKAKNYGFNYTKSAVEIFTREYLEAADELGYLVCQEMPFGISGELRRLRDDPPAELAQLWRRELGNIVTADRNHPSVAIYSMTSEQPLNGVNPAPFRNFSRVLPAIARRLNPRALIFDVTSGWGASRTRHGVRDTDLLEDWLEFSGFLAPLHGPLDIPDYIDKPFMLHEWNWITCLPDPARAARFRKSPLLPLGMAEMAAIARKNGLADELPLMVERSRKLKHVLRKDALERAYEHPKVGGYHHWLIHDVPYCPEGVFNEFWEAPADLSAEEFRTYNGETVLTLTDHQTRSFHYGQPLPLGLTVAHFGGLPLPAGQIQWRIVQRGKTVAQGRQPLPALACGRRLVVPDLAIGQLVGDTPSAMELICELWSAGRKVCWNHWPLWFFPMLDKPGVPRSAGVFSSLPDLTLGFTGIGKSRDPLAPSAAARVYITHRLHDGSGAAIDSLLQFVEAGGKLLLLSNGVIKERESCVYRTVPFNLGTLGNMGTVIHDHPALGAFPHQGWCDLPFLPMIEGAYPMDLAAFAPAKIKPIIRSIGHYVTMEDKGYLFEAALGKGVLLAASLNLLMGHSHPAGRYLLWSLIQYLAKGKCRPENRITAGQLRAACR